jgi:uncharacterized protein with NRDE domain
MCTVTFIPVNGRYYITSNRDEKQVRKPAVPAGIYIENGSRIIYPKDGDAGGTWIACHENGNVAVLLNGAFKKHDPQPPYKRSRGKVLLEIIHAKNPVRYLMQTDLSGIEPFTMIIMDAWLYECRWNGITKYCTQLKKYRPYIWSSATLYNEAVIKEREQWFAGFLNSDPRPTLDTILHFHQFGGMGDIENDLKMKRGNKLSTVSITSIELDNNRRIMKYLDLKQNRIYHSQMNIAGKPILAEIF